jgi:hypothetical protein
VDVTLVTAGTTVYVILLIGELMHTVCGIVPGGSSVMQICACAILPERKRIMKGKILFKYLIRCYCLEPVFDFLLLIKQSNLRFFIDPLKKLHNKNRTVISGFPIRIL